MFFGLRGRPVGCGFGLQFTMAENQGLGLLFGIWTGLFALFKFFKTPADAMTKMHVLLAQAQPAAPGGAASGTLMMVGYALLLGAMFWFMTSSQRKKQKEHDKMIAELKNGDEVVTAGGIYGIITGIKDDRFVVRIGDNNAKVEVGKAFITTVVKKTAA